MSANSQPFGGVAETLLHPNAAVIAAPVEVLGARVSVSVTQSIEEVEAVWRKLTAMAVESPGQTYDFIRLWIAYRSIPVSQQRYVLASLDGEVIALLPLHLKRVCGVKVLTWFPGTNAGAYAPVADTARLASIGAAGRTELWRAMAKSLSGASLLFLRALPAEVDGQTGLYDELGSNIETETLHRAHFASWEQCDGEQRSRSRRKHDRQQGDRLAALGEVAFEEITDPAQMQPVIDIMFRQRSDRFRAQGIRDCFVDDDLIGFYQQAATAHSGINVRLHVLRLDGEVVAVRYNVVHGERMFCLISSMADCPRIQSGSPGKQCLLRVMQQVFDNGMRVFDMGAGYTDEKRHWCNVQIAVRHHYVALTPMGQGVVAIHQLYQRGRVWAKASPAIKKGLRNVQQWRDRFAGKPKSDELQAP